MSWAAAKHASYVNIGINLSDRMQGASNDILIPPFTVGLSIIFDIRDLMTGR